MKRLIAIMALSTAFGLAACDDPNTDGSDIVEAPLEEPMALPAEEAAAPVAAPAVEAPPVDSTTLPPEKRSSEESVQPESETLFY